MPSSAVALSAYVSEHLSDRGAVIVVLNVTLGGREVANTLVTFRRGADKKARAAAFVSDVTHVVGDLAASLVRVERAFCDHGPEPLPFGLAGDLAAAWLRRGTGARSWSDAAQRELTAAAEALGVAPAADGRTFADLRADLGRVDPAAAWLNGYGSDR